MNLRSRPTLVLMNYQVRIAAAPATVSWAVLMLHGLALDAGSLPLGAAEVADAAVEVAEVAGLHVAGPCAESVCPSGRLFSP